MKRRAGENQRLLKKLTSAESQINEWAEEYNFLHDIITDFLTNTGYDPEKVQNDGNLKDIMHDIAYEYNELQEPKPEVGCGDPWKELKNLEERVAKMESKYKEDLMDEVPLYARTGCSGRPEAGCKVKSEDYRPGDNSDLTNGFREMLKAAFKYIDPKTMDLLRSTWEEPSKCDK